MDYTLSVSKEIKDSFNLSVALGVFWETVIEFPEKLFFLLKKVPRSFAFAFSFSFVNIRSCLCSSDKLKLWLLSWSSMFRLLIVCEKMDYV